MWIPPRKTPQDTGCLDSGKCEVFASWSRQAGDKLLFTLESALDYVALGFSEDDECVWFIFRNKYVYIVLGPELNQTISECLINLIAVIWEKRLCFSVLQKEESGIGTMGNSRRRLKTFPQRKSPMSKGSSSVKFKQIWCSRLGMLDSLDTSTFPMRYPSIFHMVEYSDTLVNSRCSRSWLEVDTTVVPATISQLAV